MAENEVGSQQFQVLQFLKTQLHKNNDGVDNFDEEFVFSVDPTLLIDPSLIKIGKSIGEGGNSIVYEGLYESKLVAVKVLQPNKISNTISAECKEKFQREVKLLSRLKHDNIVKFIGACVEPVMLIVTELVRGGTLSRYLHGIRPRILDQKVALTYALEISKVMEYLHANGIIHRDLKPGNLLITKDRKKLILADFGHAREEIAGDMTCESGTYRWMAPELCGKDSLPKGEKKRYDHKVDVYSFSIVLWELLTNKTPFHGKEGILVAYAVAAKNMRPSLDEIPNEIVPLLQSCWAENSNDRPEFEEITVSLSNILQTLFPAEPKPSINNVIVTEHRQSTVKEESSKTITKPPLKSKVEDQKVKKRRSLSDWFSCFSCRFF